MHKNWKFLHAALVVKDMDKAIKYFEALGVGPFPPFLGGPGMAFTGKTVRGKPSDYDMDLRLARGDMGGMGLELIQPLKGRSVYNEFLEKKGEGIHHIAFGVDDLDAEIADMEKRGFKVIQTGAFGAAKFAYFESEKPGGMFIELCQAPKNNSNQVNRKRGSTMLKGYNGKILRLDLTTGDIDYEYLEEQTARKYIGGVGLAVKILWDETTPDTAPLSPENELVFMTGPLTGSILPKSSRYIVAGISPLTGIWGQAHAGGRFADELRHAGFDGIVVKGQSSKPVYLWINNGKAEIRDAAHIWGKDTYEVAELLQQETDSMASVACIGVAGERLVKIAGVMNDGKQGRAAARCGLGALMGSKRLKAIAVRGTLPLSFYDEDKLKEGVQKILPFCQPRKPEERLAGDMHVFKSFFVYGRVPVKNWSEGSFDEGYVYTETMREAEPLHCAHCPNSCLESYQLKNGERHMVWEAWGPLGTNCCIANAEVLQQAYTLCNKYGLDTISAGAIIAFAMECFDKGLITRDDTDGVELTWGNHQAMMEMLRKIGEREGFGELLGEGVKRAAERIGGTASEYAMHVKGLEFPAHEPRALASHMLGYATGSIGAAHMEPIGADGLENWMELDEPRTSPELGFPVALKRFDVEGKGRLVARTQDFSALLDSITVCLFLSIAHTVKPSHYLPVLNSATGWDMTLDEFMLTGERITNLKRMFSVKRGISRKDDILPARILTQRLTSGGTRGNLFHLGAMLNEYYSVRGWSEEGIPTREKLIELGLEECL